MGYPYITQAIGSRNVLCYKSEFIEQHLIGLANNLAEFKIKITTNLNLQ